MIRRHTNNNNFLKLGLLTFISAFIASIFLVTIILHQRKIEFNKMELNYSLTNVNKKAEGVIVSSSRFLDDYKKRIKHIKKTEITEDHCVLYNFVSSSNITR